MATGRVQIGKWRGVNLDVDPKDIADDELAWSENMYVRDGPIQSRPFFTLRGFIDSLGVVTRWLETIRIFSLLTEGGVRRLFVWLNGVQDATGYRPYGLWEFDLSGRMVGYESGGFADPIIEGGSSVSAVEWAGKLYFFSGKNEGYVIGEPVLPARPGNISTDGLSKAPFGTKWPVADRPYATVAWMYRNQLMLSGFTAPQGAVVRNCEINDPETLVAAAKAFVVGSPNERIMAGMEVPVFGGSNYMESYCVIWKEHSVWMTQGQPPTNATDGSLRHVPLLPEEGLVSEQTIAKTPDGIMWCSGTDVWFMPWGGTPVRVGRGIRNLLARMPRSAKIGWSAGYLDGFYRLSIPAHDPSIPNDPEARTQEWWCDMRDGPENARWWGPMSIPSVAHTVINTEDGPKLFAVLTYNYLFNVGDAARLLVAEMHRTFVGVDQAEPGYYYDNMDSTPEAVNPYTYWNANRPKPKYLVRFKEFDFDDPNIRKVFERIEVNAFADRSTVLVPRLILDGGQYDASLVFPAVGTAGFILDTSVLDSTRLASYFKPLSSSGSARGSRILCTVVQPEVQFAPTTWDAVADIRIRALYMKVRPIGRTP